MMSVSRLSLADAASASASVIEARNDPNYDPAERWNQRHEKVLTEVMSWITNPGDSEPPTMNDVFGNGIIMMCSPTAEKQCEVCDLRRDYERNTQALKELWTLQEKQRHLQQQQQHTALVSQNQSSSSTTSSSNEIQTTLLTPVVSMPLEGLTPEQIEAVNALNARAQKAEADAQQERTIAQQERTRALTAETKVQQERTRALTAETKVQQERTIAQQERTRVTASEMARIFREIHNICDLIKRNLKELGSFGNGTSSASVSSNQKSTRDYKSPTPPLGQRKATTTTTSSDNPPSKVVDENGPFRHLLDCVDEPPSFISKMTIDEPTHSRLKSFQRYLEKSVEIGIFTSSCDKKEKLAAGKDSVRKNTIEEKETPLLAKKTKDEAAANTAALTDDLCKSILSWKPPTADQPGADPVPLHFPSFQATEIAVTHKLLCAIMSTIVKIRTAEVHITHEQRTNGSRFVDFAVGFVAQHVNEVLLSMHVVPIETKALSQGQKSFKSLRNKAVKQVIGHLATGLQPALEFGGIGVDCVVHGAVLTMISVEVLEMELMHLGTKNAKLVLRRSGNYPLFNEEATKRLLDKPKFNYQEFFQERTPLDGFRVLAALMSPLPRDSPFLWENCFYNGSSGDTEQTELVDFLGTGTFSDVYELSSVNKNSFLKVPKHHSYVQHLEREMETLRQLNSEHIPKAPSNELGYLHVHVRCESSVLRCLKLTGAVGSAASKFVFTHADQVKTLCNQVMVALTHAHGCSIAHMDVRPSNIIVSPPQPVTACTEIHVQLTDWGCAAHTNTPLSHSRGCIPYAHDSLLSRDNDNNNEPTENATKTAKQWTPAPMHDYASLAYTMATILFRFATKESRVPWQGFYKDHNVDSVALQARNDFTTTIIMKHGLPHQDKLLEVAGIKMRETPVGLIPVRNRYAAKDALHCGDDGEPKNVEVNESPIHHSAPPTTEIQFGEGDVDEPAQSLSQSMLQRTLANQNELCNVLYRGFRNLVGCPVHAYYIGQSFAYHSPVAKALATSISFDNNNMDMATMQSCQGEFKFHLGVTEHADDFENDWDSTTKFETSFISHTYVFRLASNTSEVVDSHTLTPTRVVDCPTSEITAPTGSGRRHLAAAESTALPLEDSTNVDHDHQEDVMHLSYSKLRNIEMVESPQNVTDDLDDVQGWHRFSTRAKPGSYTSTNASSIIRSSYVS